MAGMSGKGNGVDYAIDMLRDRAVFSVFRRTAEATRSIASEESQARQAPRRLDSVIATTGLILKRGHELVPGSWRIFDRHRLALVKA